MGRCHNLRASDRLVCRKPVKLLQKWRKSGFVCLGLFIDFLCSCISFVYICFDSSQIFCVKMSCKIFAIHIFFQIFKSTHQVLNLHSKSSTLRSYPLSVYLLLIPSIGSWNILIPKAREIWVQPSMLQRPSLCVLHKRDWTGLGSGWSVGWWWHHCHYAASLIGYWWDLWKMRGQVEWRGALDLVTPILWALLALWTRLWRRATGEDS